jgi:type I restriction-modification system DNA methylase subunit
MSKKQLLGQYYTKNSDYILQGIDVKSFILKNSVQHIIEPFVGEGDLIKYVRSQGLQTSCFCYDIDPKVDLDIPNTIVVIQDTLNNPPDYTPNDFVITNPPYLARNKNKNKELYDKYHVNDLYKCFIKTILTSIVKGGVIIIPLNFLCSIRDSDVQLRREFCEKYFLERVNIFEEQVFSDTSCTVCAIFFRLRKPSDTQTYHASIFPHKKNIEFTLSEDTNHSIGGEIYRLDTSKEVIVGRYVEGMDTKDKIDTKLKMNCLDSGSKNGRMKMNVSKDIFYGKNTSRTEASIFVCSSNPEVHNRLIDVDFADVCAKFNQRLEMYREKYHSLFMSNYRESKEYARKRISFRLVYDILNNILKYDMDMAS